MSADHPQSGSSFLDPGSRWPFVLLASCFLWWGIANNLTDPLVKVFQEIFQMSAFQASLIQMAFYGGYFCMAIPGALIARKFNYKIGVLLGLGTYAAGCLLLYPAMQAEQFLFFCIAYYVLACGLGVLETNANPYVMELGPRETATRRLNFAQSFNPVGAIAGILLAQTMIMARLPQDDAGNLAITNEVEKSISLNVLIGPYLAVAGVLLVVWLLILLAKMPKVSESAPDVNLGATVKRLLANRNYRFSVIAQFCYVGTQISVWTYTNFYIPEAIGVTQEVALQYHTAALVLFGIARWIFTGLMRLFHASNLLLFAALMGVGLSLVVIFAGGLPGVISLVAISGMMSLMFPTIFGLGCSDLGEDAKIGASGQIMAIIGGAILTPAQGALVDAFGAAASYALPLGCFVVIAVFAWTSHGHEPIRSKTAPVTVA